MQAKLYKLGVFLFIFIGMGSCTVKPAKDVSPNFKPFFEEYGVEGCFIMYNLKNDLYQIYNSNRCEQGYLPASTFKILNALIGLETGVITDENMVIPWDSVVRTEDAWNRDHTLASAIQYSVVPYFQEVARRIGPDRMKEMVDDSDYGRMNITKETIDRFWLWGDSRITPWEQMNFLLHFYTNKLPFSQENVNLVKKLIILKQTDKWIFRGKTGMTVQDGKNIGWYIGYLEENGNVWFYVCNVESEIENTEKFKESRRGITELVFKSMGLM
ncbi:MAG: class D beta-lactamase [Bacteroidota bacterium]|nr:class D beta-lactamase [Bacteroidota bacterium]